MLSYLFSNLLATLCLSSLRNYVSRDEIYEFLVESDEKSRWCFVDYHGLSVMLPNIIEIVCNLASAVLIVNILNIWAVGEPVELINFFAFLAIGTVCGLSETPVIIAFMEKQISPFFIKRSGSLTQGFLLNIIIGCCFWGVYCLFLICLQSLFGTFSLTRGADGKYDMNIGWFLLPVVLSFLFATAITNPLTAVRAEILYRTVFTQIESVSPDATSPFSNSRVSELSLVSWWWRRLRRTALESELLAGLVPRLIYNAVFHSIVVVWAAFVQTLWEART